MRTSTPGPLWRAGSPNRRLWATLQQEKRETFRSKPLILIRCTVATTLRRQLPRHSTFTSQHKPFIFQAFTLTLHLSTVQPSTFQLFSGAAFGHTSHLSTSIILHKWIHWWRRNKTMLLTNTATLLLNIILLLIGASDVTNMAIVRPIELKVSRFRG